MWTMSSARDSNWRPQPPNLQELEKKEAAAMPVMLSGRWCIHRVKKQGPSGSRGGEGKAQSSGSLGGGGEVGGGGGEGWERRRER